ncbi:MAG TPA: cholesterol oxidase substrate-binding domain-containing protein [Actinomycetota bacterium]
MERGISRRTFLRSAAATAAVAWLPAFRVARADASCPAPPAFPRNIELYRQAYRNWAGDIAVDDVWTCAPSRAEQILLLADWAAAYGYRLRAQGMRHNWSPLTIEPGSACEEILLVDTTQHLTGMTLLDGEPARVKVQAGATMEELLGYLQAAGLGMTTFPAPGDVTVGGVLAIDGHGAAIPALGETRKSGHTYGSVSNMVLSLTAIVWDKRSGRYRLREFDRRDPACAALLVNLGRAFITEVTLQVGSNDMLRCESFVDIPASELFASPGSGGRTFASVLEGSGRAEAIWFPFTEYPWVKVWTISDEKPAGARRVDGPYNYPFTDNIPAPLAELAGEIVRGNGHMTPTFGKMSYEVVRAGLLATSSMDLWGASKDVMLYVRPTTMRVTTSGSAVLARRSAIQQVLADFCAQYGRMVETYRQRGSYPMNMPLQLRVTGLDHPAEVEMNGASPPLISSLAPRADHPEWDVAIWFDALSFPGTPDANAFYQELEEWMHQHFSGTTAVRPEWSKGWAYTGDGPWTRSEMLTSTIPDGFRARTRGWDEAIEILDQLDPHRVFSNAFLDRLLRA